MSVTQLQHWQHLASFPLFVCWIIYKQVPEIMPFDLWVLFFSDSIRWFCIHLKLITMEVISGHSAFTRSSVSVKISTENFQWETQILRRHHLWWTLTLGEVTFYSSLYDETVNVVTKRGKSHGVPFWPHGDMNTRSYNTGFCLPPATRRCPRSGPGLFSAPGSVPCGMCEFCIRSLSGDKCFSVAMH